MFKSTIILSSLALSVVQPIKFENKPLHTLGVYIAPPEPHPTLPRIESTFLDDPISNEDVVKHDIQRVIKEMIREDQE